MLQAPGTRGSSACNSRNTEAGQAPGRWAVPCGWRLGNERVGTRASDGRELWAGRRQGQFSADLVEFNEQLGRAAFPRIPTSPLRWEPACRALLRFYSPIPQVPLLQCVFVENSTVR